MNTVYINFVEWAIQSKLSVGQCFNTTPKSKEFIINKKKPIPECILKNMHEHNTTEDDAYMYETHCHNCGLAVSMGKRYCCEECFKVIEKFNYKCNWNTSCKICYIY